MGQNNQFRKVTQVQKILLSAINYVLTVITKALFMQGDWELE